MKYIYCPICGEKLINKYSWDEGFIPYCEKDNMAFFDVPKPCVVVGVIKDDEILLLKQSYIYINSEVLVSGYVGQGENIEDTVYREVIEETGIKIKNVKYLGSEHLRDKELIMLTFMAEYESGNIKLSKEVEFASWRKLDSAISHMHEDKIGKKVVQKILNIKKN